MFFCVLIKDHGSNLFMVPRHLLGFVFKEAKATSSRNIH